MLVGRSAERSRIEGALEAARAGASAAVLVRGEPGVGKSALLRFGRERAGGMLVLEAQGVQAESELAYAGLSQLLAPVLDRLDGLVAPQRHALRAALGLEPGRPRDRFAAYAATLSLVALAAEERPLLAVVDDAHWLDTASAEAVAFVVRRLGADGIAILLAARESDGAALDATALDALTLGGMDAHDTAALVNLVAPVPVAGSVVEALRRATAGNPLALSELIPLLGPAQLRGAAPLPEPLPVGPDIERAFGSRIAALGEEAQGALVVAAAEETGELETIARALRLRGFDVSALAGAEIAELVTLAEGRVRFAHPLLRSAAYHRAPAPARRDAHAALAEALGGAAHRAVRRAWHLAAATLEPNESVASELQAVAMDASERAAPAAAGRAFETAARLTPEGPARVQRLLHAGRAYHLAGSPEQALGVLDRALSANADPRTRADIQHVRAQVEWMRGSPADARALLVAEAAIVEPYDRARTAVMLLEAAMTSSVLGEPREMLRLAEHAFPMTQDTGGPVALLAAVNLGIARILRGDAATGYPLLVRARPLVQDSDLAVAGFAATWLLLGELFVGNFEEARQQAVDLVARIRAEGALMALPYALHTLTLAEFFLGNWRVAHALSTEAIALAEEVGQRGLVSQPRLVVALIAGAQGRITEARDQVEQASTLTREQGVGSMITMAGWARGQIELGAGRYDDAIATLGPAGRFSLERGLEEPGVANWAQELAEAYIRVGRVRDAEATLEILEEQARRTGRRLAHAGVERCRGLLAGDDDFEAHFQRALAWHAQVPCPFERARTELCFGERLRRARHRTVAREPLRRALATFEDLGARPWADRASAELRATGEHARRRTPDTADELTPQELLVAQLIAEGATNREAAAALFVTPKTIETHLSHVYRKVGVRSRVELSRRLAVGSP